MLRAIGISLAALAIGLSANAASAQTARPAPPVTPTPAPAPAGDDENDGAGPDIIVQGRTTPPGSAIGDIPPEQVLSPADVRSYGVSSLSDLLTELSPETASGRGSGGPPVVLLNGKRISSFAEIRDIPTEAIARVDILPEEVALKYGYRADQRVVNFVLRSRFRALTLEASDAVSTDGGRNVPRGELDGLKIQGSNRVNLDLNYQSSAPLLESQRNLVSRTSGIFTSTPGAASPADLRDYRTLLSGAQTFSANMVYSRPIGKVNATVNGRVQIDSTLADLGLAGVSLAVPANSPFATGGQATTVNRYVDSAGPLTQSTQTIATHLGAGFNGDISPKWRWNLTANYDRSQNETFTETGVDTTAYQARLNAGDPAYDPLAAFRPGQFGALPSNRAYSTQSTIGADGLINGQLFSLPAGAVNTAIRLGAQANSFDTRSVRFGATQTGSLSRNIVNGQVNLDVPLTSRRTKFLDAIGDLSLNGNLAVDHLSDFGTLYTFGYGANWSPTPSLRILVSVTDQDQAPTQQQLGNPVITTPNVRVFDYVLGQSVDITRVDGGNPNLVASDRHVLKVGGTYKPFVKTDLTVTANYIKTGIDNPIESFPADTPQIEAAYPGRFTRDASGQLTRVDARPVNFLREDTQQLRYGFNLSIPLKSRIQKQFEAFRAGKGPNPFQGLQGVFGRRGPGGQGQGGQRQGGQGQGGQAGQGQGGQGRRFGGEAGQGDQQNVAPPSGSAAPSGASPPTRPDGSAMNGGTPNFGNRGGFGGGGFGGRGGGGRGGRFGAAQAGGRLQFAAYHTWNFVDRVTVANGILPIDLLNGGATGTGGGTPRHQVELQAGYSNNGLGFRLSGNYQSATDVTGGTLAAPTSLHFGSLAKFDLRVFDDFTGNLDFIKKHKWAAGLRVSLGVSNLFDTRQRVTDQTGVVPVSYQGAYLDPLGRTVRLSVRKLFF